MSLSFTESLIKDFYKRSFWITIIFSIILSVLLPVFRYYYDIYSYKNDSLNLLLGFVDREFSYNFNNIFQKEKEYYELQKRIDTFMTYSNLVEFKIWDNNGKVLYSFRDKESIGKIFKDNKILFDVLKYGKHKADVENVKKNEDIALKRYGKLLEMYVPVLSDGKIVGAVEVYKKAPEIELFGVHSLMIALLSLFVPILIYWLFYGQFRKASSEIINYNNKLELAYSNLKSSYFDGIRALSKALELRDMETEGHSERVVAFSAFIGEKLKLCDSDMMKLIIGSYLHDIGKIGISDTILLKPGRLTPEEREIMETHVLKGYNLIKDFEFLKLGGDVVLYHHEKWDGSGYPHKIKGEEIPITARIFAIVDVFDALRSKRAYKEAFPLEKTREILLENRGSHFDPYILEVFLSSTDKEINGIINEVREKGIHHTVKFAIEKFLALQ